LEIDDLRLRPLILAGGLGTRLRPRTNHLPKPLLPVLGRPLLWYAVDSVAACGLMQPVVVVDYLRELIRAYFDGSPVTFCDLPGRTMAQAVFEVAEVDDADAFLGMSSDVLVPKRGVRTILALYRKSGKKDTVLFVRLSKPGHKKWEFCTSDGHLSDIRIKESLTDFERVLLILNKESLIAIRKTLPNPVKEGILPEHLRAFQTGWILLLKALLLAGVPIVSEVVNIPVCNINVASDFQSAESFVAREMVP
jgi:NDP-sugar pyrophosphorylase family protein